MKKYLVCVLILSFTGIPAWADEVSLGKEEKKKNRASEN